MCRVFVKLGVLMHVVGVPFTARVLNQTKHKICAMCYHTDIMDENSRLVGVM